MGWMRYAIYWVPGGKLGNLGSDWLGWDARQSRAVGTPVVKAPGARRYGFHTTLKPPFRLARNRSEPDLLRAAQDVAAEMAPVEPVEFDVARIGGFFALRPTDPSGLATVASAVVRELDGFRTPPRAEELAKRRGTGLTERQEGYLANWGYPYVLEEFRPHLTLSDAGADPDVEADARRHFAAVLGRPHPLDHISLVGEDALGRFHVIEDISLGHASPLKSSAESATLTA